MDFWITKSVRVPSIGAAVRGADGGALLLQSFARLILLAVAAPLIASVAPVLAEEAWPQHPVTIVVLRFKPVGLRICLHASLRSNCRLNLARRSWWKIVLELAVASARTTWRRPTPTAIHSCLGRLAESSSMGSSIATYPIMPNAICGPSRFWCGCQICSLSNQKGPC